mgnify:CR=1 FL=1
MHINGGYKTQTVTQLANIISAYDEGSISLGAVRTFLAAIAIVAAREAAKRSKKSEKKNRGVIPRYLKKELCSLTGLSIRAVSKGIAELETAGLVTFQESEITFSQTLREEAEELCETLSGRRSKMRPVPLPRPILRFLAGCNEIATLKTALCYCVRGLSITKSGGEISANGSAKASWIASLMGLSLRSVRNARSKLIAMGWIHPDTMSTQWKLNRTGAYFEINLEWSDKSPKANTNKTGETGENTEQNRIPEVNSVESNIADYSDTTEALLVSENASDGGSCGALPCNEVTSLREFALPTLEKCFDFAPPYKYKKTPNGSKHQKTLTVEPTGVFTKQIGKPRITNVVKEDLFSFQRVETLYFEAVERGLVKGSENDALNFLAAAIRAREAGETAPKIFIGIVKKRLWMNITQVQEDQARKAIMKYREEEPWRFRVKY